MFQRKQFEFVLDEKTRESSQLKADIQKHLQHIGAQSKAIDKLQEELKACEEQTKEAKSQMVYLFFFFYRNLHEKFLIYKIASINEYSEDLSNLLDL
jgi:hypothetical protein